MRTFNRLRAACIAGALTLGLLAQWTQGLVDLRLQGLLGAVCLVLVVAACSSNPGAVNWRTVAWGVALQVGLALFILKFEIGGVRPGYAFFSWIAQVVRQFLEFTNAGARFVFGDLANEQALSKVLPSGFVFAFTALPTVIFVSAFFTLLYYVGVLQLVVAFMARVMMFFMRTSGAETLSATANVFMGQTEAPIIVKPYVPHMTQSELLALMVGGLATISGGVMAVYIGLGADPIAILTTSVMAAPCGLYLSKILLPETEEPLTLGEVKVTVERTHVNALDAIAAGTSDGLTLALNIAAMLIVFLAFLALIDHVLGLVQEGLTLAKVFAFVFSPMAVLLGVPTEDVPEMADLLGTKLVATEFIAFIKLTGTYHGVVSERTHVLATYALTGFANFASIGILLGGIGGMAPSRRGDLARLGMRALLAGFVATMVNAAIASMFL
ncbi:MAG TPA: nucleoside transporter C-terminal domain-containing protein [Vicinamibacterales bacterium]|nr:nucleoside transporter C-terminal domain-containing protein [Vicinamibacterales bacterium]